MLAWLLSWSCVTIVQGIRISPSSFTPLGATEREDSHSSHGRRLKNVDVVVPTSPDDHLVESLPFLPEGSFKTKHYAGHLPASSSGDKYFFYWLFEPDLGRNSVTDEETIPLLIWLNGGPGCSSMDGLFLENGPFRLETNDENEWVMRTHDDSWHKTPAYVLYIDQPVGTGLSFTTSEKYPRNDKEVNQDFYYFLTQFLKLHSDSFLDSDKTTVKRPFFFSGESHAGHYIPSMMAYILDQNEKKNTEINIPLTGAAIGNGWVDPTFQYAAAGAAYGYSLIDLAQKASLDQQEAECQAQLSKGHYTASVCFGLLDHVIAQSEGQSSNLKVSQYDARKRESKNRSRTFPPGHKDVESYLGGKPTTPDKPIMASGTTSEVLKAIHATAATDAGQRYLECTDPPYNALSHQDGLGVVPDVVKVLEDGSGITMMFFNGVWDLICNHVGNELFLQALPWKHQEDWIKAERYAWVAPPKADMGASGYVKEYENLIFLKVMDSGHMVPMDVPEVAFAMMQTFLYGGSFDSNVQNLGRSIQEHENCPVCPTTNCDAESKSSQSVNESGGGMKFVVRHSWIGALLAVVAFLVAFVVIRRRYDYQLAAVPVYADEYDLELKEQQPYRDRPLSNGGSFSVGDDESKSDGEVI